MKKQIEEVFITEDGMRFTNEKEAQAHEQKFETNHFKSKEALIAHWKETDIWKSWYKNLIVKKSNVAAFEEAVESLAHSLMSAYPKVFINGDKRAVDINCILWDDFKEEVVLAFFFEETSVYLQPDKIMRIYEKAYTENHSYGIVDTFAEFSRYIEVVEIVLKA